MANRKVQLYLYCKLQSGWRYCAAYYANGTIKHWVAVTPGGEKKFPGAKYYLYTARKWEMAGSDPVEAVRATEKRQGETLIAAATTPDEQQPLTLARAFDQQHDLNAVELRQLLALSQRWTNPAISPASFCRGTPPAIGETAVRKTAEKTSSRWSTAFEFCQCTRCAMAR